MPKNAAQLWIQLCDFTLSSQFFFSFTFNICVNKENYENTEKRKKYTYTNMYILHTPIQYTYIVCMCVYVFLSTLVFTRKYRI